MNYTAARPKQKIPRSQKDQAWIEQSGKYYKGACAPAIDRAEALKMYRLANGELDEDEYLYVTNPINTARPELMGYPAKMRNSDIISPNVNLMLGEKIKRFFIPGVYASNTDYQSKQLEQEQQLLVQEMQKMFIEELRAMGHQLDPEQVKASLEDMAQKVKNLPDELSNDGQLALEYIIDYNDIVRFFRKGFYDYICTAMVFSYRDVTKSKTVYDIISPLNFFYIKTPQFDFVEDGEACKAIIIMSLNQLYDTFQDLKDKGGFTKEFEDFIDRDSNSSTSAGFRNDYYQGISDVMPSHELHRKVFGYLPEERFSHGQTVEHIVWRSQAKVGQVIAKDIFGNEEKFEVSEDYKVTDKEEVEWEWVDEIWEVYCVNDKYYLGGQPIPIQKGEFGRPHRPKLTYNGRMYPSRHTTPQSFVKKGEAYQKAVNIIKYRAEETLAKNLDKIVLFPLGLIPKKEGWNIEKMLYYVRAFSFLFFDDSNPHTAQLVSALKDLNLSMADHIFKSYEMVQAIKTEWDQICGFNPQRKAEISASAGKGVTEIAQQSSATMSEELYLSYEEFERREYACLLELSKYAFSDGVQAHFIRLDGTKAFLNIHDPSSFVYSDFGIFVKNGSDELNKLQQVKSLVLPFIQNGTLPGAATRVIESNNFAAIHKIMDEADAKSEQRFQQEQQNNQSIQQSKEKIASDILAYDYYSTDLKSATDIQVASITQGMEIADGLKKAVETGDTEGVAIQQQYLRENGIKLLENATKIKDIESKERMNKDNNITALKNKVSGEK